MAGTAWKGSVLLLKAPRDTDEDPFVEVLEQAGYRAVLVPVLSFTFINQHKLAKGLGDSHNFSGIIFTSPRSVQAVTKILTDFKADTSQFDPGCLRCYVVGQATADRAKEAGFLPEGMDSGNAEKLAKFIIDSVDRQDRRPLLFPCAQMRRDTLVDYLHSKECSLEEIVAYETVPSASIMTDIASAFACEDPPNSVVYFSPSGVQFTKTAVDEGVLPLQSLKVYALGPSTQQAILSHGYHLTGVAAKPDPASLLQLLQND